MTIDEEVAGRTYQYKHGDRPLEGYTIQRAAGRGGFGEVYFAVSDGGREVALKLVMTYEQIELRGIAQGNLPSQLVLETTVPPSGWFGYWTRLLLTGEKYKQFGEVTAWRATLWEGQRLLGEQQSFLW